MNPVLDYFAQSPEAVAALLIAVVSLFISTVVLAFQVFRDSRVTVRLHSSTGLISVDSALADHVDVTFYGKAGAIDITNLRQINLEIYNTNRHPIVSQQEVTIELPDPRIRILGVTAANATGPAPRAGGRKLTSKVVGIPIIPSDPLVGHDSSLFYPAVVVTVPNLEGAPNRDWPYLRITYDGPPAKLIARNKRVSKAANYYVHQFGTLMAILLIVMLLIIGVLPSPENPNPDYTLLEVLRERDFWLAMGALFSMLVGILAAMMVTTLPLYGATERSLRMKPITKLLEPIPLTEKRLQHLRYYDTLEHPPDDQPDPEITP